MQEGVPHLITDALGALCKANKIVNVYIYILYRFIALMAFVGWHCEHVVIACLDVGGIQCVYSTWGIYSFS